MTWTAVPAPAPTPAPIAAPLPPPAIAPMTAPTAAPPQLFSPKQMRSSGMIFSGTVLTVAHLSSPGSPGITQIKFKVESAMRGTRRGQITSDSAYSSSYIPTASWASPAQLVVRSGDIKSTSQVTSSCTTAVVLDPGQFSCAVLPLQSSARRGTDYVKGFPPLFRACCGISRPCGWARICGGCKLLRPCRKRNAIDLGKRRNLLLHRSGKFERPALRFKR